MVDFNKQVLNQLHTGIILLDSKKRIAFWNRWLIEYTGKREEEVIGQEISSLYPLFKKKIYQDFFRHCLEDYQGFFCSSSLHPLFFPPENRKKVRQNMQIEYLTSQGEDYILLQIFDVTAQEEKIHSLQQEIRERKRVEKELKESEERLWEITDNMHDMVCKIELSGEMVYVSPSHEKILGLKRERLLGDSIYNYVHPLDKKEFMATMERIFCKGTWGRLEFRFYQQERINLWVESTIKVIKEGSISRGAIITTRDISKRKEIERALRESEEQLDSILDSLDDGIYSKSIDTGKVLFLNQGLTEIYGQCSKDLKTREEIWHKAIYCHDREKTREARENLLKKNSYDLEYRIVRNNGEIRWLRDRTRVIRDENKEPLRLDSIIVDITRAKEAERELKEKSKLLEGILHGISDIIAVQRPDHTIELYNQAGYQFLNLSPEDVKGKKCYKLLGSDKECEVCATRLAIKSKSLESVEKYIPEMDMYLSCRSNPILNEEGQVSHIIEQIRDITPQKKLEEEIRRSEDNLRSMISLIPDLLIIYSPKGEHLEIWAKDWDHLILPKEELIGRRVQDVFPGEISSKVLYYIHQALESKELQTFEYTLNLHERMEFEARFLARNEREVLAIIRNITEQKRREKSLKEEMERARQLQESLLPSKLPDISHGSIGASHQQASHVSGDFYDFIRKDNHLYLLMADVTGHGFDASLVTIFVSSFFRRELSRAHPLPSPLILLKQIHHDFLQQGFSDDYSLEIFFGLCNLESMRLQYAVAGAIRSLLVNHRGQIRELTDNHGMIINNIIEVPHLGVGEVTIEEGESLLVYTDGIDEPALTKDGSDGAWVEKNIGYLGGLLPLEEMLERIIGDTNYSFKNTLVDDMSIIGLSFYQKEMKTMRWNCPYNLSFITTKTREIVQWFKGLPIDIDLISIALYEALSNAIDHGENEGSIPVEATITPEQITLSVLSKGDGFNWRKILHSTKEIHGSSERGRGLSLIKMATHRFTFNEKGTRITMSWDLHKSP